MGGNRLSQRQARTHRVWSTTQAVTAPRFPNTVTFPAKTNYLKLENPNFYRGSEAFHLDPEKVALKEPGEQRRGMEPKRNGRVSVSQGGRGPPPSVTTRQPRPSGGVRAEAGGGERSRRSGPAPDGEEGRGGAGASGDGGGGNGGWGRGSRGRGALCEVPTGVAILTRGEGSGPKQGTPTPPPPPSGEQEKREGRPSPWPPPRRRGRPAPSHRRAAFGAADSIAGERAAGGKRGRPPGSSCRARGGPSPRRGSTWRRRVGNGLRCGQTSVPPPSHPSAPAPTRVGGRGTRRGSGPGALALPTHPPAGRASHHRSSSRLSSCRLPDCTPWAPRPPPPPGSGSSSCCCCCCRRGSAGREKGWGEGGGGSSAGNGWPEGGEEGTPGGLGTARPRRRERGAGGGSGANSRHWGGGGGSQTTSGGLGEVGRVHCGLHGGERGPTRKRGLFSLEVRGLLLMNNLQRWRQMQSWNEMKMSGYRSASR